MSDEESEDEQAEGGLKVATGPDETVNRSSFLKPRDTSALLSATAATSHVPSHGSPNKAEI